MIRSRNPHLPEEISSVLIFHPKLSSPFRKSPDLSFVFNKNSPARVVVLVLKFYPSAIIFLIVIEGIVALQREPRLPCWEHVCKEGLKRRLPRLLNRYPLGSIVFVSRVGCDEASFLHGLPFLVKFVSTSRPKSMRGAGWYSSGFTGASTRFVCSRSKIGGSGENSLAADAFTFPKSASCSRLGHLYSSEFYNNEVSKDRSGQVLTYPAARRNNSISFHMKNPFVCGLGTGAVASAFSPDHSFISV